MPDKLAPGTATMIEDAVIRTKICARCKEDKRIDEYHIRKSGKQAGKPYAYCKNCNKIIRRDNSHKSGKCSSMETSTRSSLYLGVVIAERILSHYFEGVVRMPNGTPGYDFTCRKGHKIDVKSSCRYRMKNKKDWSDCWQFNIKRNKIADYFFCIAFDNRESLEPEHVWLIPGNIVNNRTGIGIRESRLVKWNLYEKSLDKVIACCITLRKEGT